MSISCVYQIKCLETGKVYIGSAVNFGARKSAHICNLNKGSHHSIYLQRAWNKYGDSAFVFSVLEPVGGAQSLIEREQHYLDKIQPFGSRGFNISKVAGSTLGVKRTPEQIEKTASFNRGKKHSEAHRAKISKAGKGRKHSDSTKRKMRKARLANNHQVGRPLTKKQKESLHRKGKDHPWWGRRHTEKTREKISAAKASPVIQVLGNGIGVYWPSAVLAAKKMGLSGTETIYRSADSNHRSAAGFHWRRFTDRAVVS